MAEAEGAVLRGQHAAARVVVPPPLPPREHRASCSSSCTVAARTQSRLHNFSFPSMSWGSHRLLRCVNTESRGVSPSADCVSTAESDPLEGQRTGASPPPGRAAATTRRERGEEEVGDRDETEEGEDECLEKFMDAMMADFQKAVDRIPLPQSLGSRREESKGNLETSPSPACEEASRPWNLRLRRAAACSAPPRAPENGVRKATNLGQTLMTPEKSKAVAKYSERIRSWEAGREKEKRPRFSPVLSKDEIEEDFFLMTSSKVPRRPRKRPRNVQKQIEMLYPGFYLTEITPDLYTIS